MLWYPCLTTGRQSKNQQCIAEPAPAAQQFSSEEIRLYKRRLEEGYDLPDPRYRLWLASITAEGPVAASSSQPAANDIPPPPPTDLKSACQTGRCKHPKARKWVQCDYCPLWYHCLCAGIPYKMAQDKKYKCVSCSQA